MLIQLDAAQVIDLIDDNSVDAEVDSLRYLLSQHTCAISVSVVADLRRKTDQPPERYAMAFRKLKVLWAIDGGMICSRELKASFAALLDGGGPRNCVDSGFVFREGIVDAICCRVGVAAPRGFRDLSFGALMSNQVFKKLLAEQSNYVLPDWLAVVPEAVSQGSLSLRSILLGKIPGEQISQVAPLIAQLSDVELIDRFPANALMVAVRRVTHEAHKNNWSPNDIIDLWHIPLVAYCDASFLDKSTKDRVCRAQVMLGKKTTAVQHKDVLRFLKNVAG